MDSTIEAFAQARKLAGNERESFLRSLPPNLRGEILELLEHHEDESAPRLDPLHPDAIQSAWESVAESERAFPAGFRIIRRIGSGSVGTVYEAEQERPCRRVALKVLNAPTRRSRTRFEREAHALARLQHPGIAQIYSLGVVESGSETHPYLVMELVDGPSMRDYIGLLPVRRRVEFLRDVCRAVAHAHEKGVIHRDLKPANILVAPNGTPKVVDFGLARAIDQTSSHTVDGDVLGTIAYMSPEQAEGAVSAIDTRSDVYSLGVIAFEALARRLPVAMEGLSVPAALKLLRESGPARLPGASDLTMILGKAMARDHGQRYATAAGLADDLDRYLAHEPVIARPPAGAYRLRKFVVRHRVLIGATSAVVAALVIALVVTARFAAEARHAAGHASVRAAGEAAYIGDAASVRAHLDAVPEEERAWEWHYLRANLDRSIEALPISPMRGHARAQFRSDGRQVLLRAPLLPPRVLDIGAKAVSEQEVPQGARGATLVGDSLCFLGLRDGRQFLKVEGDPDPIDVAGESGGELSAVTGSAAADLLVWAELNPRAIYAWDMRDSRMRWTVQPPQAVGALAVSPNGSRLALGMADGHILILDARTGERVREFPAHRNAVSCITFSPDGSALASGGVDHRVCWFDAATGERRASLKGHLAPVESVSFRPDGARLVSGGRDAAIRIWDLASGECESVWSGHEHAVFAVAYTHGGSQLVSIGGTSVRRWNVEGGAVLHHGLEEGGTEGQQDAYVYGVAFSPDGTRLASCGWDRTLRLFDSVTRQQLVVRKSPDYLRSVAWRPDGRAMVTAGSHLDFRDGGSGALLREQGSPSLVHRVAYSPNGKWLALAWPDGVDVYRVATGERHHRWEAGHSSYPRFAFDPSGRRIAYAGPDGSVIVRWVEDGAVVRRLPSTRQELFAFAFSPDGRSLASAGIDGKIRIWDLNRGVLRSTLGGHVGHVYALAYLPDGTRLASGGADHTVRIWDPVGGDLRLTLRDHHRYVFDLCFSPDGQTLASASGDTTVRLWSIRGERDR